MSDRTPIARQALGKRLATYRSCLPRWTTLAVYGCGLLAMGMIAAERLGPSVWWASAPFLLWGCAWVHRRHPQSRRLDLYQHGVLLQVGRRQRSVLWNQVFEIYQKPKFRLDWTRRQRKLRGWHYRLVQRDGRSLRLREFESLRGLGMRAQKLIAQRQLPVALDAFRAGYCVRFGRRLSVSSYGIQVRSTLVAWRDIAEIFIDDADQLRVRRIDPQQGSIRLPCHQIPNLLLLDGLLQAAQAGADCPEMVAGEDEYHDIGQERGGQMMLLDRDETNLLLEGFDWDDIDAVHSGQLTIDELLRRGPRYRPKRPR